MLNKDLNYFTFYWADSRREVALGTSSTEIIIRKYPECNNLPLYVESGITESWYWYQDLEQWVKYEPLFLERTDLIFKKDRKAFIFLMKEALLHYNDIIVTYDSEHRVVLSDCYVPTKNGYVNVLKVSYDVPKKELGLTEDSILTLMARCVSHGKELYSPHSQYEREQAIDAFHLRAKNMISIPTEGSRSDIAFIFDMQTALKLNDTIRGQLVSNGLTGNKEIDRLAMESNNEKNL